MRCDAMRCDEQPITGLRRRMANLRVAQETPPAVLTERLDALTTLLDHQRLAGVLGIYQPPAADLAQVQQRWWLRPVVGPAAGRSLMGMGIPPPLVVRSVSSQMSVN